MTETTWRVKCPNCGAKLELGDGGLEQDPPFWVGTGCIMWIDIDLQCGHPLSLDDVLTVRRDASLKP